MSRHDLLGRERSIKGGDGVWSSVDDGDGLGGGDIVGP